MPIGVWVLTVYWMTNYTAQLVQPDCLLDHSSNSANGVQAARSRGFWRRRRQLLTSLMLEVSVSIIVRRSIPIPQPAVGGNPYSRLVQKPSSINIASSSPCALACMQCALLQ